jgi:hypothetical protein
MPLSIAYALNDSPLGFLAWMYQLYFTVSDNTYNRTASEVITQALMLYIPGVYGNIRACKELYSSELFAAKKKSLVPTSALQYGSTARYTALTNWNCVVSHARLALLVLHFTYSCHSLVNGLSEMPM